MTDEILTPVNPGDLPTNGEESSDAVLPPIPKTVTLRHTDSDTGKIEEYGFYDDAPLVVEDGCLTGTLSGSFPSPYTGRVENYELLFDGLPIDGIGGGSGSSNVEVVNIECDLQAATVTSCDKTFAELEAAVNAGKPVIGFLHSTGLIKNSRPVLMTLSSNPLGELKAFVGDMNNFIYPGSGSIMNLDMVSLVWESTDELPTLSHHVFKIMLQPNE